MLFWNWFCCVISSICVLVGDKAKMVKTHLEIEFPCGLKAKILAEAGWGHSLQHDSNSLFGMLEKKGCPLHGKKCKAACKKG